MATILNNRITNMRLYAILLFAAAGASAFIAPSKISRHGITALESSRRGFLVGAAGVLTGSIMMQQSAMAIPLITVDEFGIILRDSPMSIEIVEFSGPKGESVEIKLVDGTSFGLKDIVESPTDPRSPLKVAAACRENSVKTRFVDLEALLSKQPKKKLYTNQRVQEAQAKTRAQEERMRQDEQDRIEALQRMEVEKKEAAVVEESTSN